MYKIFAQLQITGNVSHRELCCRSGASRREPSRRRAGNILRDGRTGRTTWSRAHAIRSLHFLPPRVTHIHTRARDSRDRGMKRSLRSAGLENACTGGKLAAGRRERRGADETDVRSDGNGGSDTTHVKGRARLNGSG